MVEWERTCALLCRWLPPAPARVLDVGGASGRYASWLRGRGHRATLIDPVPRHVELARARGVDAAIGDARRLPLRDAAVDVVLLMGPLYHLPLGPDRAGALGEAVRVCAPGGVVVAAGISRWSRPAALAAHGRLGDREAQRHLIQVLTCGHDAQGDAFERVCYRHDPAELRGELSAAGLRDVRVVGVEGPLGAFAREDLGMYPAAMAAAAIAEASAPHLSLHLLAYGSR